MTSFVSIPAASHFSLRNIPFGVFSLASDETKRHRIGTAIGEMVLDVNMLAQRNIFAQHCPTKFDESTLLDPTLNRFASLGRPVTRAVRQFLQELLRKDSKYGAVLRDNASLRKEALLDSSTVQMHLPMEIGDYTDFYAGIEHATRVGILFRGKDNALQPNYCHIPIGYHGRCSSIVASGTPITRPCGQIPIDSSAKSKTPEFTTCKKFDIELELAAFVALPNKMGSRVTIDKAEDHLFGVVVMNDWSARDIQAWEYVPLGPFNGKNFGTTLSPWIVTFDALEPFMTELPDRKAKLLPYLEPTTSKSGLDINLEVHLKPRESDRFDIVSITNARYLYWSFAQMLVNQTSAGCPVRPGDLLGSGTISGPDGSSLGSFLEASMNGKEMFEVAGTKRSFLEDGDEIDLVGWCDDKSGEGRVGFGHCTGVVLPAV